MSEKYVLNPVTGRSCRVGGKAYRELVKSGKIKNMPFERNTPDTKKNKPIDKKKKQPVKKPTKKKDSKVLEKYDSSESFSESE